MMSVIRLIGDGVLVPTLHPVRIFLEGRPNPCLVLVRKDPPMEYYVVRSKCIDVICACLNLLLFDSLCSTPFDQPCWSTTEGRTCSSDRRSSLSTISTYCLLYCAMLRNSSALKAKRVCIVVVGLQTCSRGNARSLAR